MFNENENYNEASGESAAEEKEVELIEEESLQSEEIAEEHVAEKNEEPEFTDDFTFETENNRDKKKGGLLKGILTTAVCACVAGIVFSTAMNLTASSINTIKHSIRTTQENIEIMESTEVPALSYSKFDENHSDMSIENIAEACLPSVVSITNKGVSEIMTFFGNYQQESLSSGSGIIIGENDTELLIVTNYHVIADAKELTVVFYHDEENTDENDTSYMNIAKIKGYDEDNDIAVIAVNLKDIAEKTRNSISIATIGDSKSIKLGSKVVAIGNALGYGQSVTHGIISAVARNITMKGVNGKTINNKYIQTDAGINEGNSGGALLNMKGELIGINSAKIVLTGVEAMGYAIPISNVEDLISELMNIKTRDVVPENERGYLGIYGTDVTSQASKLYGLPVGVFVQETIENSPADKSDLEAGDIIVKIDEVSVANMTALQDRLTYYKAGETVTITIKRQAGRAYEELKIEVKLGTKENAGIE